MRVTNQMMSNSFLRDLGRNLSNLNRLNNQLTSGKEISKPSDNPIKVARSMQLHSDISANKQYNENIKDTISWLESTDTALEQMGNTIQRVRELMISSGNATYGSDEKNAIKDEINEKISELAQILNTNFDGKYLFGGTKTGSKPVSVSKDLFDNNEMSFSGKDGLALDLTSIDPEVLNQFDMIGEKLIVEISQGVKIDYNVNAKDVLYAKASDGSTINVMELMNEVVYNLGSSNITDSEKVVNENLSAMDEVLSNINRLRSEVGSKQNRMEAAKEQNEDQNYNMTDVLSKTEDIDLAEKTMQVTTMQSIYMAALQTSAKILQPSLMDFL